MLGAGPTDSGARVTQSALDSPLPCCSKGAKALHEDGMLCGVLLVAVAAQYTASACPSLPAGATSIAGTPSEMSCVESPIMDGKIYYATICLYFTGVEERLPGGGPPLLALLPPSLPIPTALELP
jgi:hypothetical protein